MFIKLFLITFFTSVSVSFLVNKIFAKSIRTILAKLVQEKIAQVFTRYVYFAIYVIGLSGGVNIYSLERYLKKTDPDLPLLTLNADKFFLEIYKTIIETLQSITFLLFFFFLVTLVSYVLIHTLQKIKQKS